MCACGATGCWEAYVSNRATVARYLRRPVDHIAVDATSAPVSIAEVMAAAHAGDARALAAVQTTARYLGLGLGSIVNALDPDRVYIGGEITLRVGCHRQHRALGARASACSRRRPRASNCWSCRRRSLHGCSARPRSSRAPAFSSTGVA